MYFKQQKKYISNLKKKTYWVMQNVFYKIYVKQFNYI